MREDHNFNLNNFIFCPENNKENNTEKQCGGFANIYARFFQASSEIKMDTKKGMRLAYMGK